MKLKRKDLNTDLLKRRKEPKRRLFNSKKSLNKESEMSSNSMKRILRCSKKRSERMREDIRPIKTRWSMKTLS
jgi:hypothetical protein